MGSMTKVMQRLRENPDAPPEPVDGAAPLPPAEAQTKPVPTPEPAMPASPTDVAAPDQPVPAAPAAVIPQPATESPSGFVPTPADSPAASAAPERAASVPTPTKPTVTPAILSIDDETATWDPARVDPVVVAFHDRYSAACEQFRSVRARLLTLNAKREPQVLTITSAIPEEGKSASTLNLGLTMAEGGEHRILLADADFRRTSLARMLGIRERPGLADVLGGEASLAEAIQPTPFPNLKILPAGRARNSAYGELLGSTALAAVLAEFRRHFDYTFLDTPPVTTVSDVCLIAPKCDGAIVIIEMRRTPEPAAQQAVRTLQSNNVKVLGALLSRFSERGAGYYYYYDRYYYYHRR